MGFGAEQAHACPCEAAAAARRPAGAATAQGQAGVGLHPAHASLTFGSPDAPLAFLLQCKRPLVPGRLPQRWRAAWQRCASWPVCPGCWPTKRASGQWHAWPLNLVGSLALHWASQAGPQSRRAQYPAAAVSPCHAVAEYSCILSTHGHPQSSQALIQQRNTAPALLRAFPVTH